MDWIKTHRVAYKVGIAALSTTAIAASVYMAGYPWNCQQAIQVSSLAELRLRRSRAYPPGTPYRQFRETGRREANALVKAKCEDNTVGRNRRVSKFFLKYRSDY